jgi:hypothetical protein
MEAPIPVALDFTAAGMMEVTHGLHAFAAKSPPALAQWAIAAYSSRGDVVVDPMVGSGTTDRSCRPRRGSAGARNALVNRAGVTLRLRHFKEPPPRSSMFAVVRSEIAQSVEFPEEENVT